MSYIVGMTTSEITPVAYYALCARAAWLGIPTQLDPEGEPQTVQALAEAVVLAEQRAWVPGVGEVFPLREEILTRYGLAA